MLDTAHPGATNFINDLNDNGTDDTYHELQNRCTGVNGTGCTVYNHTDGSIRGYGLLAEYSVEYCPLDDHLPYIFILFGLFVSYKWKQRLNFIKSG